MIPGRGYWISGISTLIVVLIVILESITGPWFSPSHTMIPLMGLHPVFVLLNGGIFFIIVFSELNAKSISISRSGISIFTGVIIHILVTIFFNRNFQTDFIFPKAIFYVYLILLYPGGFIWHIYSDYFYLRWKEARLERIGLDAHGEIMEIDENGSRLIEADSTSVIVKIKLNITDLPESPYVIYDYFLIPVQQMEFIGYKRIVLLKIDPEDHKNAIIIFAIPVQEEVMKRVSIP